MSSVETSQQNRPARSRLPAHQCIADDIELVVPNVGQLFKKWAEEAPDKVFLIAPDVDDEVYTYAAFLQWVLAWETWYSEHGIHKGTRINLIIPNGSSFVATYFAALGQGITVVPINPNLAPKEMVYIINDSRSELVIFDEILTKKVKQARQVLARDLPFVGQSVVDRENQGQVKQRKETAAAVGLLDEAVVIYTSGTTGNPKGVVLNHLNLLSDAKALSEWFSFDQSTRALCILPLFHNNGQVVTLLAPLYAGGSTVITKGQTGLLPFWDLVKTHDVTWTSVMPSILSILLQFHRSTADSPLQGVICGGQVLKSSVQDKFEQTFGVPVFEGFGLTETTSFACFNNPRPEERVRGTVGRPLPINEMAILDPGGNELGSGAEGEICIRGYNVACEYLGLPEKNEQAFAGGWFHSGDFGYKDGQGYYHFLCRHDDLIITGGENIYPAEIENVLFMHPSVVDCAAIGVPHPLLGETICAFVQLEDDSITEKDLKEFCMGRIAFFKLPQEILIINKLTDLEEIPKGPTKKILYRELKQYYQERVAAGSGENGQ